jgi:hypothetical protein
MVDDNGNINEPEAKYESGAPKKEIIFFNSFDEAEEYRLRKMASHSYEERLANLEILRSRSFNRLHLTEEKRPPMKRIITIEYATYK